MEVRSGGRGWAAPLTEHTEGMGAAGGAGAAPSCTGFQVSCLSLVLSPMKSEKEFLIREGSYRLSASRAPERYGGLNAPLFLGEPLHPCPQPSVDVMRSGPIALWSPPIVPSYGCCAHNSPP